MTINSFFATCPKGLESLLLTELKNLGVSGVRETLAGVHFEGSFQDGMKACLWSRFASRILMELSAFDAADDEELYAGAAAIPWDNYFTPNETIAVDFSGSSAQIRNTQYGAVKVKDAVCDYFQRTASSRPSVNRQQPDVQIYCHLDRRGIASVALDLSGGALLRREFSRTTGTAPLKENLAAAMVVRAGYDGSCCFFDPMCGSGTLLIEAALLATDTAPGLRRRTFGFFKLKIFEEDAWKGLKAAADVRARRGLKAALEKGIKIIGFDADSNMVDISNSNAFRAGFETLVNAECRKLSGLVNPFAPGEQVVIVTNPPYGRRMGSFNELIAVYTQLGAGLKQHFQGARAAVISSSQDLLSCMRLHADKVYKLYNGELECQLRVCSLNVQPAETAPAGGGAARVEAFSECLRRNLQERHAWAQEEGVNAYRIYDAEVPDFAAAIDYYDGWYVLQAYTPREQEEELEARHRVLDMIAALVEIAAVPGERVIVKSRMVQHGDAQYEKAEEQKGRTLTVSENGMLFLVNLEDYLDTGLFLDGRLVRRYLKNCAQGRDFLNLFAYTGSASVAAALGGAGSTLSVDMSRTYLLWARDNFRLNKIPLDQHRFIQADVLAWLQQPHAERFDLVYVDPPTFSNSKRMSGSFDVSRDHLKLLSALTRLLKDEAQVVFCCNRHGFRLDDGIQDYGFESEDLSDVQLPADFRQGQPWQPGQTGQTVSAGRQSHYCFLLKFARTRMTRQPEPEVPVPVPKWQKELKGADFRRFAGGAAGTDGTGWTRRVGGAVGAGGAWMVAAAESTAATTAAGTSRGAGTEQVLGVWGDPRSRREDAAWVESEYPPGGETGAGAASGYSPQAYRYRGDGRASAGGLRSSEGSRHYFSNSFKDRSEHSRTFRRDARDARDARNARNARHEWDRGEREYRRPFRRAEGYGERRFSGDSGRSCRAYGERGGDHDSGERRFERVERSRRSYDSRSSYRSTYRTYGSQEPYSRGDDFGSRSFRGRSFERENGSFRRGSRPGGGDFEERGRSVERTFAHKSRLGQRPGGRPGQRPERNFGRSRASVRIANDGKVRRGSSKGGNGSGGNQNY